MTASKSGREQGRQNLLGEDDVDLNGWRWHQQPKERERDSRTADGPAERSLSEKGDERCLYGPHQNYLSEK